MKGSRTLISPPTSNSFLTKLAHCGPVRVERTSPTATSGVLPTTFTCGTRRAADNIRVPASTRCSYFLPTVFDGHFPSHSSCGPPRHNGRSTLRRLCIPTPVIPSPPCLQALGHSTLGLLLSWAAATPTAVPGAKAASIAPDLGAPLFASAKAAPQAYPGKYSRL